MLLLLWRHGHIFQTEVIFDDVTDCFSFVRRFGFKYWITKYLSQLRYASPDLVKFWPKNDQTSERDKATLENLWKNGKLSISNSNFIFSGVICDKIW